LNDRAAIPLGHILTHWQADGWIMHPADRLIAARALLAPIVLFAPFAIDLLQGYAIVYAVAAFALIGDANYLLHLHIHRPFGRSRVLNLIFDLCMGAVTAMTASNWRIQHLYGHHRRVDLPYRGNSRIREDYSAARALSGSVMSMWKTFCSPIAESFRKGALDDIRVPISYRWAFCEQMLLILLLAALTVAQPRMVLIYLLPWYLLTHFITRYVDYLNHYGCDEGSDDPYVRANNSLSRWFNLTTHNFGYHAAHHIRPGAHWTELPAIHAGIADRIPQRHLKAFSWSWVLMPYHFYLSVTGRM
jgi:fatty acid desaturase